jgi:DNA primase
MRYGEGLLDEILRRTDIVQLVGRRVKLMRKGRTFWGLCPFHKEKSPSFKVDTERRNYKCFGCGAGGSAYKWLMEAEGLSFREAVERLAADAGVELPKWTAEDESREQRKKSLYEVIDAAALFFESQLATREGARAHDYLVARGLDAAAIKRFRLGFAPASGTALIRHLTSLNISLDDMVAAGLARAPEDDRPPRDFFFNRVIFPIADFRGHVVAFGARTLEAGAKPKYINTGETPLFSKGEQLYNFASARAAALKAGTIIVAEGYMDVIALVCAGFEASVAPLGTALTTDQLSLLWRVAPEPLFAFDGDEAGQRAAHRAATLALPGLEPGHSLRFMFLPPGEDPDSLIRNQGAPAIQRLLESAEPLAQMLWRMQTEGRDFTTPERRAGLERSLGELIGQIADGKVATYYRRDFDARLFELFRPRGRSMESRRPARGARLATRTGLRIAVEPVSPAVRNSLLTRTLGVRQRKEEELMAMLLMDPELALRQGETLASLPLSNPLLDRLRQELLNLAASDFRLEIARLQDHFVRAGLADLVERLLGRGEAGDASGGRASGNAAKGVDRDGIEARWMAAAHQLREIAEVDPERKRAVERFKSEASEESWRDAHRLLIPRAVPDK